MVRMRKNICTLPACRIWREVEETMKLKNFAAASMVTMMAAMPALAETTIKIAGFGAASGVVGVFGKNSEAAIAAAVEQINSEGGVTLANGGSALLEYEYYDDRCNAEEGISVIYLHWSVGLGLKNMPPSHTEATAMLSVHIRCAV